MARGCDARRTRTLVIVSVREWGGENEPLKCDGGEEGLRSSVASSSSSKKSAHAMTGESGLSGIRQLTASRKPYLICDGRVNASGLASRPARRFKAEGHQRLATDVDRANEILFPNPRCVCVTWVESRDGFERGGPLLSRGSRLFGLYEPERAKSRHFTVSAGRGECCLSVLLASPGLSDD
jgi:hypothetical protein